jgi:hypothetical protein
MPVKPTAYPAGIYRMTDETGSYDVKIMPPGVVDDELLARVTAEMARDEPHDQAQDDLATLRWWNFTCAMTKARGES